MICVAVWRFYAILECDLEKDQSDFVRSVVIGLLRNALLSETAWVLKSGQ